VGQTWRVTTEEMNVLRIFERKVVGKILWTYKIRRILQNKNKEIKDILQEENIIKFIKSL
jgi:hypothetical protein